MRNVVLALAVAGAAGTFAAESVIPQAVAEKSPKTEFKVDVRQEWTHNLLGDGYGRYVGWPTGTRLKSGELAAVFSDDREAHVCPHGKVTLVRSKDCGYPSTVKLDDGAYLPDVVQPLHV